VRLYRLRPGALSWARWLLAAEVVGAVLYVLGDEMAGGRDLGGALIWLCMVLVIWAAPNAFAFHKARSLFVEPAKEKPGL